MSGALRVGVKRVVAATARPAQVVPRRAMSDGQTRLLENRKIFQANPHLHGETILHREKRPGDVLCASFGCFVLVSPLLVYELLGSVRL